VVQSHPLVGLLVHPQQPQEHLLQEVGVVVERHQLQERLAQLYIYLFDYIF
jgi:hypothetical protein